MHYVNLVIIKTITFYKINIIKKKHLRLIEFTIPLKYYAHINISIILLTFKF